MKKCALCKLDKDDSEFNKNPRNKDGLHSYCKKCNSLKTKLYFKTEKGKTILRKYQKEYYKTDKGKISLRKCISRKSAEGYYRYGKGAIPILKQGARKRNISFNLTADSLEDWWKKNPNICYYCGISQDEYIKIRNYIINYKGDNFEINKFKRFYRNIRHKHIKWLTIDRADNSRGYEIENIVKCCWICNSIKSDFFSEDIMKQMAPKIIKTLKENISI